MSRHWELIEARVDWITATARIGEKASGLLDFGATLLTSERERGNHGRPTNFEGYHGTTTKHCFVGYRLDGACIRLGGAVCGDNWRKVAEHATNVSRLDVAVTVTSEPTTDHLALDYYNASARTTRDVGRPAERTLIQSRLGGQTFYCGKRSSERFGRVYDKYAESKGLYPPGSWRFEIEYKGAAAKAVSDRLMQAPNERDAIQAILHNRFNEWDITVPWDVLHYSFNDRAPREQTDNDTRFKWLQESVRPSIEKLSAAYTAEQLRQALGLQHVRHVPDDPRIQAPPVVIDNVLRALGDKAVNDDQRSHVNGNASRALP